MEANTRIDPELSRYLQDVGFDSLPAQVVATTKLAILDLLGVQLAATTLGEGCEAFADLARDMGGLPQATVLHGGFKTSAALAAMANGALSHAVDYDSVHDQAVGHPESSCIPAALALAEMRAPVPGKTLITAVAIGSDLFCRLGLAITKRSDVWFDVGISGAYAAAVACGKVLGLSATGMVDAMSLAASQCTCTWEFHETRRSNIRAVREAFSAQAGVQGALLAHKGVAGVDKPIGGKAGFFGTYAHGNYDADRFLLGLGKEFLGGSVAFKPYPSCRGTHAFVDAAIELANAHNLQIPDIRSVKAIGPAFFEYLMKTDIAGTAMDAKFSMRYCVAAALQRRRLVLDDFDPQAFQADATVRLGRLLSYEVDPSVSANDSSCGALEITLADGRKIFRGMQFAKGHPANPLSHDEVIAKFRDCASHARTPLSANQLNQLIDGVLSLESCSDAGSIMRLLASAR